MGAADRQGARREDRAFVRNDCFGGETLRTLDEARVRAVVWCHDEAGMLALATSEPLKPPPVRVIAIARFLRPVLRSATDYALQRPLPLVPAGWRR